MISNAMKCDDIIELFNAGATLPSWVRSLADANAITIMKDAVYIAATRDGLQSGWWLVESDGGIRGVRQLVAAE